MTVYCDTSVLVAACEEDHPHHAQAWPALLRVRTGQDQGCTGLHSLAELFSSLTRLPVQPRIHPAEAARKIHADILPHFQLVAPDRSTYLTALERVAQQGWPGGMIYDALLLQCALQCGAERIYTFNLKHFRRLAPPEVLNRICAPA